MSQSRSSRSPAPASIAAKASSTPSTNTETTALTPGRPATAAAASTRLRPVRRKRAPLKTSAPYNSASLLPWVMVMRQPGTAASARANAPAAPTTQAARLSSPRPDATGSRPAPSAAATSSGDAEGISTVVVPWRRRVEAQAPFTESAGLTRQYVITAGPARARARIRRRRQQPTASPAAPGRSTSRR